MKRTLKKYLKPKQCLSLFGCDVIGLQGPVVDDVGVGAGVVMACGDGAVVVVEV